MKFFQFLFSTRTVIAVLCLLVLGATGAVWFHHPAAPPAMAASGPVPVTVAPALEMPVTEWDEFSGRIKAIEHVDIRPRVSGTIDIIHFEEGQIVKKGDLLFTIDPRPFQAELARTQAVQAGAQARLALAKLDLDRSKQLVATHAVAQSEFDQRNDAVLEAEATLKAADAAVQTAQLNLDYTAITAPVTGRVSRAEITVGNLVQDGSSAPVLTSIVSVSPVYVEFEIDEQTYLHYASHGAAGNTGIEKIPVSMGLASETDYPHQGHLKSIDNELNTTSGTIRVRAIFDNTSGNLTPGLYARVRTGGSSATTAVLVDDRAVGTDQDKKYVMVIGADNKASYRAVVLGPMVNGMRVIRSGLQKNERIVVNGLQRVRPNSVVVPTEVTMNSNHTKPASSDLAAAASK